ncbi:N-acyl-D-glucosamine 2-epimerase [Nocardiopsis sp. CNR-923]|uniref:AGE family epimerase/isomerase n=1 Tax=Nocardiopsis sp. CNR-923 TaxID=1904965 RepID=UPI000969DCC9|nr:AGE family epimerase/isomerase [Nocardiopsis sp. CNR-923]OLT28596.1 N-acyl-D-glucosamine 2-epimerase [Nocardiopsis sp. CNR-923]
MTASQRSGPGHPAWLRAEERRLLAFAARSVVADGFGWLDARGRVEEDRPTATWITARMTHVFALAHLRGEEGADRWADHGLAALAGPLRDAARGGWYEQVPDRGDQGNRSQDEGSLRKDAADGPDGSAGTGASVDAAADGQRRSAYTHAFVVLAAASAALAGRPGARDLLDEALRVVDAHFWEESARAVRESWDGAWTSTEDYRGANSNMHCVEAFLAAADATGDRRWTLRALAVAERLVHRVAADHGWRLPEHFTSDWRALPDHNRDRPDDPFRPFGSTTGHLLEWARLLVHLELALRDAGEAVPDWLRPDTVRLFDHAVRRGWAADGADGFVYTLDWADAPVVRERMHWVVAEATMAAWALGALTGDDGYARHYDRWWDYADRHHLDREHGSWHHELDPAGRPAGAVWPGKPDVYHAYQATVLPQIGLAGSLAAAAAGNSPTRGTWGAP